MATTTQAMVKAALKAALLARTYISTNHLQIAYGEPGDVGRSETIWIGTSEEEAPQEQRAFRKGLRDEDYEVRIHTEAVASTPETSEARAVVFAAEVEQAVIDNSTLGVANVSWIVPAGIDLKTIETEDGSRTTATVHLRAHARLT